MRRAATPGEVAAWSLRLEPLPPERRLAVIKMLSEAVAESCRYCEEPVRRCDSRGNVTGWLVHLRCAPERDLTGVQHHALRRAA
jgi:hypothetical protein